MKTAKLFVAVVVILISALNGCTPAAQITPALTPRPEQPPVITPEEEDIPEPTHSENYINSLGPENDKDVSDNFSQMPGQDNIMASVLESGAVAEYRVFFSIIKGGLTYYYKLRVYEDGWGEFAFIIHQNEWFKGGGILLNYDRPINKDDTDKLLKAITDNDFWNIPSEQPDDKIWLDGISISVEGYSDGKEHHISMMCPGEEYGIYKISKAFSDYGETFALDLIHID